MEAVMLPDLERRNAWIVHNARDFVNEVDLLYSVVAADGRARFTAPGEGFPPRFEYRWKEGAKGRATRCSSAEYVDRTLAWVVREIDGAAPPDGGAVAADCAARMCGVFKRMLRVFAIMFASHFDGLRRFDAEAHFNTSLKRFVLFALEFDLVEAREYRALGERGAALRAEWERLRGELAARPEGRGGGGASAGGRQASRAFVSDPIE
jgi:MOB kinase activator 1